MENELAIRLKIMSTGIEKINAATSAVGKLDSATNTASGGGFNKLIKTMQSAGSRINVLGQRMTWMVTVPLLAFANKSIETAVNVDTAFLRFRKVFQGTEEDMIKMKQTAFDLSIKFGTSFEEVTEALTEFNKAGINSAEDLTKLGEITSKTSILFDTDMKEALDGVKSMMFGYGLTIDETAQALDAINIIADQTTASEKAVLEVMNRVAGTARQAGFSIREVAAAQGVFEASAIPAGRAGNALKSILTSLNKQSTIAKDQWEALGVKMTSVEWKTSNASDKLTILAKKLAEVRKQGDVKSLKEFEKTLSEVGMTLDDVGEIADSPIDKLNLLKVALVEAGKSGDNAKIDEISKALGKMGAEGETVEQKISFLNETMGNMEKAGMTLELNDMNEAMASLVGKFQINNLNVLLQDLAKNFDDNASTVSIFYDALSKSDEELVNAAWGTEQLNKVLDSNVIKLAQSKARYQEVTAEIGEKLLPIKIQLIEKMSELLDKFNNMSPEMQDFIIKLGIVIAVLGPVITFLGLTTSGLGFLLEGIKFAIQYGLVPLGTAITGSTGVAAAFAGFATVTIPLVTAALLYKAVVAFKELQQTLKDVGVANEETRQRLNKMQERLNTMEDGPAKEKLKNIMKQSYDLADAADKIKERYEGIPGVFMAVGDQIYDWFHPWKNDYQGAWGKMIDWISDKILGLVDWYNKIVAKYNNLPGVARGFRTINEIRLNSGGIVYAAQGMLAKGRDIIPAMLSPGEMVLNRSQQSNLFDIISGKRQLQTAGGPTVNINVGYMIASRGEQREFARKIKELLEEDSNRY